MLTQIHYHTVKPMQKVKTTAFVVLLLALNFLAIAQSHQDSVKAFKAMELSITSAINQEDKLDKLVGTHYYQMALIGNEINEKNCFQFNTSYAKQGIDLAIELEKYDTLKSLAMDVGYVYDLRKQYDTSFNYYYQCLDIFETSGKYELTYSVAQNILYNSSAIQKEMDEANKLQQAQKRKIEWLTYAVLVALLLFIGFLIYYYIKTNNKNKALAYQKAQIQQSKLEIDNSIEYAQNIQQAILSNETVLQKLFPQSFVLFLPKDKVSGDFLWTYQKGHLNYVAVADCTGHGVPGALLSIVGHFLLDSIINSESYKSPADILKELHELVVCTLNQDDPKNSHNHDGMDVGILEFNTLTNELTYSGANRTLLHLRNTELKQYKGSKRPIGGTQFDYNARYTLENCNIQMQKDDLIYSYSDGYQDQIGGEKSKKFMSAKLVAMLQQHAHDSLNNQKEIIKDIFIKHKGHQEQVDDVLIIGIKF